MYTGHGIGSGTTANVSIQLNGTKYNSRVSLQNKIDNLRIDKIINALLYNNYESFKCSEVVSC